MREAKVGRSMLSAVGTVATALALTAAVAIPAIAAKGDAKLWFRLAQSEKEEDGTTVTYYIYQVRDWDGISLLLLYKLVYDGTLERWVWLRCDFDGKVLSADYGTFWEFKLEETHAKSHDHLLLIYHNQPGDRGGLDSCWRLYGDHPKSGFPQCNPAICPWVLEGYAPCP